MEDVSVADVLRITHHQVRNGWSAAHIAVAVFHVGREKDRIAAAQPVTALPDLYFQLSLRHDQVFRRRGGMRRTAMIAAAFEP